MTIARCHLVDASVTRWYHCVTRCVRRPSCSGRGRSIVKAGSNIGSRNLLKSSRWPLRDSRSWITTCTSWSGSTRMWPRGSRMTAVSRQHIGPEPVEDLLGQLEENRRLARAGRPLGATGDRGHDRDPDPVDAQVDHLGRSARSELRLKPPGGKLQGGKPLVERRFALGVQDPCRERAAIHPPPGQQLEQLTRTQGCAAGGVQVTVDRGEEQAHWIPGGKAVIKSVGEVGSVERTYYDRAHAIKKRPPSGDTRKSRAILS